MAAAPRSARSGKSRPAASGLWLWLGVAALWLVFDQFTKYLIVAHYQLYQSTTVTSFFNVVRVHNYGAAFSFLAGAGGWQRWFFMGIGIGAGARCDGQVLVLHDMLGITPRAPKFSQDFMGTGSTIPHAIASYVQAVKAGTFPQEQHSFF